MQSKPLILAVDALNRYMILANIFTKEECAALNEEITTRFTKRRDVDEYNLVRAALEYAQNKMEVKSYGSHNR